MKKLIVLVLLLAPFKVWAMDESATLATDLHDFDASWITVEYIRLDIDGSLSTMSGIIRFDTPEENHYDCEISFDKDTGIYQGEYYNNYSDKRGSQWVSTEFSPAESKVYYRMLLLDARKQSLSSTSS